MNISSTELKTRMGKYLKLVQSKVSIVITDRGEAVATLSRLEHSDAAQEDIVFSSIPKGPPGFAKWRLPKFPKGRRSSSEWLDESRGDR